VHNYVTPADFIRGRYGSRSLALSAAFTGILLVAGLFTRWFDRYALLLGWLAGMLFGTIAAYKSASPTVSHWASSSDIELGHSVYIGFSALLINVVIAVILTLIFRAVKVPQGADETLPHQYTMDPAEAPAAAPAGIGAS
jgi:SSS family solute:Na+ symporter